MSAEIVMSSSIEPGTSDKSKDRARVSHSGRVLRNRRYSELRDCKRLFTPEIKRCLKAWLVRRRVHPYPSRAEKRGLALHTGLTYIQICNWFANWRRKLKNVSADADSDPAASSKSWSHRIVVYNERAEGNVEQLNVSSEDSIWQHGDAQPDAVQADAGSSVASMDHSYSSTTSHVVVDEPQCLMVSSTTSEPEEVASSRRRRPCTGRRRRPRPLEVSPKRLPKWRSRAMKPSRSEARGGGGGDDEKVTPRMISKWRANAVKPARTVKEEVQTGSASSQTGKAVGDGADLTGGDEEVGGRVEVTPRMLHKWRASAENFQPARTNHIVPWSDVTWVRSTHNVQLQGGICHELEELEAAEALTRLARLHH